MNKLIMAVLALFTCVVRAENVLITAVIALDCDDLDTVTITQVNVTQQPIQIMQGYLDPSGFWLKESTGIFDLNSELATSTAASWHFEHFEWPRELILMESGEKYVSIFKISDFFATDDFEVATLFYRRYINIIVNDNEVFTSIKSNRFVVSEECPAVTDSG
jgi:hypothetical protein